MERLTLRQPLDYVDEYDVAVVLLGKSLGGCAANVAGADNRYLIASHPSPL